MPLQNPTFPGATLGSMALQKMAEYSKNNMPPTSARMIHPKPSLIPGVAYQSAPIEGMPTSMVAAEPRLSTPPGVRDCAQDRRADGHQQRPHGTGIAPQCLSLDGVRHHDGGEIGRKDKDIYQYVIRSSCAVKQRPRQWADRETRVIFTGTVGRSLQRLANAMKYSSASGFARAARFAAFSADTPISILLTGTSSFLPVSVIGMASI